MAGKKAKSEAAVEPVEEVTEAVETEQTAEAPKAAEPVVKMYVGPTLPKFGLVNGVVYEGYPPKTEEFFGACEMGRLLFIDINQYPQAEIQIRTGKGYFWDAYKQALACKNGGK